MIGSIDALVALDRRAFHTCTPDEYRAFQRWTDWCEVGGNMRQSDRDHMATVIPTLRAHVTGEQADILVAWLSMMEVAHVAT